MDIIEQGEIDNIVAVINNIKNLVDTLRVGLNAIEEKAEAIMTNMRLCEFRLTLREEMDENRVFIESGD